MTKPLRYVLFTLAVPAVALGFAALWMPDLLGGRRASVVYDTSEITRGLIRKTVSTSGPVRALVTVQVGSQLSGQIAQVPADFNTEVRAGDVMAVLDAKTFAARVSQARGDLAAAEAQLVNQQASLEKAKAILRQSERAVERQRQLAARGIAAQAALDNATRDNEVAAADVAISEAQIATARATVVQRRAALEQAQIDLDRTEIRAPINGTVISRTVDVGQTVAASLQAPELFKIAQDLRRIRIEAQVNEADVGLVAEGNPVEFTVDAYPERKFTGRVSQVRLAATELQNIVTYAVIVEAANEDRRLFPGMTANVQIEVAYKPDALRISNDALRYRHRDTAPAGERGGDSGAGAGGGAQMRDRVERLKVEIGLTDEQADAVLDDVRRAIRELRAEGGGGPGSTDLGQFRARIQSHLEKALARVVTDEQRPRFETWRSTRRDGQVQGRSQAVWVLDADGRPQRRMIRLGISDDTYTEVLGTTLTPGDRVISRAREARK